MNDCDCEYSDERCSGEGICYIDLTLYLDDPCPLFNKTSVRLSQSENSNANNTIDTKDNSTDNQDIQ